MQKIWLYGLAFTVCLGCALGLLLYVSLIPYFPIIGKIAIIALCFLILCGCFYAGFFTYCQIWVMLSNRHRSWINRNVIFHGDVAAYLMEDGSIFHLTAEHERAKSYSQQQLQLTGPTVEGENVEILPPTDETILQIYKGGRSMQDIVKDFKDSGLTYYKVQKVIAAAKKAGRC